MNANADSNKADTPVYEPDDNIIYTLEMVTRLSGVDSTTILRYQEQGLITREYDSESLRRIRHIHQVETEYEAGPPAVKLIMELCDELENLRTLLRRR